MKLLLICVVYTLTGVVFASQTYPVSEGFSGSASKHQQAMEGDGWCSHRTNYSMIIKTNESIADKAVFLDFQKGKTKEECLQSCCSLSDCNLAVYENKEQRNCYLFNCGTGGKSRCHFAHHEGYLIMTLKSLPQKSPLTKLKESQHEDELEGLLDQKAEKSPVHADVKPTDQPKIETTAPLHKSEDPDAGQLYAECADGLYCEDPNAVCRRGVCVCKSGYNSRFQTCRAPHEELSSQNPSEGRDGRPPINTSAAKDGYVGSPQQTEKQDLPAFVASAGKAWEEQSSQEDQKQTAETSEMREDSIAPAKMFHNPEQELKETEPLLKKEKVLNSDATGETRTGDIPLEHSAKTDGEMSPNRKLQLDANKSVVDVDSIEQEGPVPGEQHGVSIPHPAQPDYHNRTPSRSRPYQLSHRPGVMRGPTADSQPDKQPDSHPNFKPDSQPNKQPDSQPNMQLGRQPNIQPDSQPNIQPDSQPNIQPDNPPNIQIDRQTDIQPNRQPMRQPVRQPSLQPIRQPVRQPGRQPIRQPNRQPVRQPMNPRTRYPYPYNIDADRSQVPQYPVHYPSYEWDYRPDDYGGPFRSEDYNPGAVDQDVYDFPYRHSNYGPDDIPVPSKSQHTNRVKVNPGKVSVSLPGKSSAEHLPEPVMTTAKPPAPTTTHVHAVTAAPTSSWGPAKITSTTTTAVPTSQSITKAVVPPSQNSTGVQHAEEVNGAHDVAVEQIIIASPTDSAQGPIVALALGLAFTLMLLIFVGCRLRNVKRRIRKGRALHSNEADYLINGMYL